MMHNHRLNDAAKMGIIVIHVAHYGRLEFVDTLVDLEPLPLFCASVSKKSVHVPASESPLDLGSEVRNSVESEGVLGVRCQGDIGVRRLGFDAPGRASPACSRCSTSVSRGKYSSQEGRTDHRSSLAKMP